MIHVLTFVVMISLGAAGGEDAVSAVRKHRERQGAGILAEFSEMLSIPNVASDAPNIRRNAEYIRGALARRGVKAELLTVPDAPPHIYGEIGPAGAGRTLGIYVHYDGQPVDIANWKHDPWQATLYTAAMENGGRPRSMPKGGETIDPEWRLYARSAGDDKAPIVALLAVLDALQAEGISITSRIKFLFEGEEEAGSPHLRQYMETYRDRLDVDAWIICDGPSHQSRRPQLVFGVRGVTGLDITVYGANRYLHSGHYGNWAPNPSLLLAHLLAGMKDESGRVLIDGYYDSGKPLGPAVRKALKSVPAIDDAMRREFGLAETEGRNAPYSERLLLPSLNIKGLSGGPAGKNARNVIPSSATASIDVRLVEGNDPEAMLDLVEAHIKRQGFHIVREDPDTATRLKHARIAKVVRGKGYPAARTRMDIPIVRNVIAAAERAVGGEIIRLPTLGGSLPLYLFTDLLDRPTIVAPIANHDNNQHAPNENIRLANLWYGMDLMAALLTMPAGN